MPHISKLIALLAFFVLFQSAPANAVSGINHNNQVKLEPLKFLFVGNSMTNRNDLPGTFKRYVETSYPGMQIDVAMLAPDGETLSGHKNSGAVAAKIMAMRPNYLILQPGAEILAGYQIDDAPRVLKEPTDFFDAAAFFIEQANAVSAVPVLFSYQLNRAAMTIDVGFIDYPFARAAAHPGTKLVNAGIMISDLPASLRPSLIAADGMHPSPIGTAAGAIAIAQTLFGAPPLTTMTAKTQFNLAREITPEIYMQLNASAQKMLSDRVQALPQRPIYGALAWPEDAASPPLGAQSGGIWRARQSGMNYSLGGELELKRVSHLGAAPRWKLVLTDYQLAAALRYKRTLKTSQAQSIDLLGVQPYKAQIRPIGNGLQLLVWSENGQSMRKYRTAIYQRVDMQSVSDKSYFATLGQNYQALSNTPNSALPNALKRHFAAVNALIPPTQMQAIMKAYARSEWDMLNAADSMQVEGASSRALAYIKAATVLYPQSSDAQVCLGTALAKRGRQGGRHADKYFAAARLAFAAAQKNPVSFTSAYIEQEIAKLPAR